MGLYEQLSAVSYAGEWGETLYDFFLPETAEGRRHRITVQIPPTTCRLSQP